MDKRENSIEISKVEFQKMGYQLIDTISNFLDSISDQPVTTSKSPKELQSILGNSALPKEGKPADQLLTSASKLLFDNSLLNGHPKFSDLSHHLQHQ